MIFLVFCTARGKRDVGRFWLRKGRVEKYLLYKFTKLTSFEYREAQKLEKMNGKNGLNKLNGLMGPHPPLNGKVH